MATATLPPGITDTSGAGLAGPPPNPVNNPASQPGFGGVPGTPVAAPAEDTKPKLLAAAGMQIDQLLTAMSKVAPESGAEFSQCRAAMQAGIAKAVSPNAGAAAISPTETGPGFTGAAA